MTARCGDPVCGGRCYECVGLDNFWDAVDAQLDAAEKARSFDELVDAIGGRNFGGSGGDRQLPETLIDAGWTPVYFSEQWEHHRYLKAPNGDVVEYCEGDLNLIKAHEHSWTRKGMDLWSCPCGARGHMAADGIVEACAHDHHD